MTTADVPRDPDADTAGIPWTGRTLSSTGFDDDTGSADPRLLEALTTAGNEAELVGAVAAARLLVPVVADPTDVDTDGSHAVEKQTDMALVTLVAPDGARALPVFSGLETLLAWDSSARPVPVTAARAAQAGAAEGCDVLVVDVGSRHARELRPSMLWALAQERTWRPAHEDPTVTQAVGRLLEAEAAVEGYEVGEGEPAGRGVLGIALVLRPRLGRAEVAAIADRVGRGLTEDEEVRPRLDGVSLTVRSAE